MKSKQQFSVGILLYTYDRIQDAKINMEILKHDWMDSGYFSDVKIVHMYNGKKEWYPEKYLEDDLVYMENSTHYQGASELMDSGIQVFGEKYSDLDYVIMLASDTWNVKSKYVHGLLRKMQSGEFRMSTCGWGVPGREQLFADIGIAVDYCILDLAWITEYKMFPIRYAEFRDKYRELLWYQGKSNVSLEKLILTRFMEASHRESKDDIGPRIIAQSKMLLMKDREPVHSHIDKQGYWQRKHFWPEMGLLTHHNPLKKQKDLKRFQVKGGKYLQEFIKTDDFSYFNRGRDDGR